MIKVMITICIVFLFSCEDKEKHSYNYPIEYIGKKLVFYVKTATDIIGKKRCDGLTFLGLWDAYGGDYDVYGHEYAPGEWHRDIRPCYPDDSRSEISVEGVLGAMHAMIARGDYDRLKDFWTYMEHNDWIAGSGPKEYTRMAQLRPITEEILKKNGFLGKDWNEVLELSDSEDGALGYKGNVLADYIALHHLALGYLNAWHVAAAGDLVDSHPPSPLYGALYGCYESAEAYQTAINTLGDDGLFPGDRLPDAVNEGLWDWSDGPQLPMYALTYAVLESCNE